MKGGWRRRLLTGTNAILVMVLVIATVFLIVGLTSRYRARWDLSEDALSTLAPETLAALEGVEANRASIEIVAFSAQKRDQEAWVRDRTMKDFLREVEYSSPMVSTRFVDFDKERLVAESWGVSSYGTVVVQLEGGSDRVDIVEREVFRRKGRGADRSVEFLGEASVTRAILQLLATEGRSVYLLQGHGERRLTDTSGAGLSELAKLLENQGWSVDELDLVRDADGGPMAVPADADAVLMAGPRTPLMPEEEAALRSFVADGGRVGFFVDPGGHVPDLMEQLGVVRPEGVVLDTRAIHPYIDRPVLSYGQHLITDDLIEDGSITVLAHLAALEVGEQEGARADKLLRTSRFGWIERSGDTRLQEEVDVVGPHTVAWALTYTGKHPLVHSGRRARVLAVGDSDLLTDDLLTEGPGNRTFSVNSVRWLVGEDERMSRVGRATSVRRLALSEQQLSMIRWLVIALLPLIAVLVGGAVYTSRRGR